MGCAWKITRSSDGDPCCLLASLWLVSPIVHLLFPVIHDFNSLKQLPEVRVVSGFLFRADGTPCRMSAKKEILPELIGITRRLCRCLMGFSMAKLHPAGVLSGLRRDSSFENRTLLNRMKSVGVLHLLVLPWMVLLSPAKGGDAQSVTVKIRVDESEIGLRIPPDFVGFSYEKNVLALEHFRPSNMGMVRLMRNLGKGVLRFGGNYLETTHWKPKEPKAFSNAHSVIGTRELEEMYAFASASGWTVIHGLNLGVNDPQQAADEAATALWIGGTNLIAFEIGNEPEHYAGVRRPESYGYDTFSHEVSGYLKAMRSTGSRVPLAGPATTSNFPWFEGFIRDFRDDLVMTTRHNYPLAASSTDPAHSRFATIENLLSPATATAWRQLMLTHQKASAKAGVPFRVGESGSASSGGKPGVSDVFASSLWCADYLFDLASIGVGGVNFHGSFNCRGYTSFCALKEGGYHAHAHYYGMLFFSQAAQGRMVGLTSSGGEVNLTQYAVLGDDGVLRVALINKDLVNPAMVQLKAKATHPQSHVMRLAAPSVASKEGISLAGGKVTSHGSWIPVDFERLSSENEVGMVLVPPASAALVVFGPRRTEPQF